MAVFVEAARAFCSWAEGSAPGARSEALVALRLLTRLRAAALELPAEPEGLPIQDVPDRDVSQERRDAVYQRMSGLPFGPYWLPWQPTDMAKPADVVVGDLSDDLADIWGELAKGLQHWDAGELVEAVWEWSFGFQHHWGLHCSNALWVLHWWFDEDKTRWTSAPA